MKLPFINWKEVQGLPGTKPAKIPWSASTNEKIDPHDPANWLDKPDPSLPAGVVLSDRDPYFLFDIDDALMPDNTWHPHAQQLCQMFPGAAMEVSHNGKGLHIIGQCNAQSLGDRRNKFKFGEIQCEFYHTKRFVALGRGLQGNADTDWTATLAKIVPVREVGTNIISYVDQAVEQYTGPNDDDQLISLMLAARGSAAQLFGDKASISDLWNCNVEVLSRLFPSSSGDAFDRSSADAALMSHLAFYTGKNPVRMDRLFQRSGLMREKYEKRQEYRAWTISGAIKNCKLVYDKPRQEPKQSKPGAPGEILDVNDQIKFFTGCVYVMQEHAVMVDGGDLLKPATFKAVYGGHEFVIASTGKITTTNAFEAFTENRIVKFPKAKRTRFKPTMAHGVALDQFGNQIDSDIIVADGVNIYSPQDIRTVQGDPTPFLDLISKLLPDHNDQQILMNWMASLIQNQGKKFLWSPVLQGTKGNGKSAIGECLTYAIGDKYSWTPKASKIDARFNSYLRNRIFVNVEEMHMFHKYELLEALKDYITGTRQEIEGKGTDAIMDVDYCANWIFFTNHKDAVIKERDDRRFAMFFTAQQSREDMIRDGMLHDNYFPKLWNWLRQDGFAIVRDYLLTFPIDPMLDPAGQCFMAPNTSSTNDAIEASHGVAEQYVIEARDSDVAGFRNGWVSTYALNKMFADKGIKRSPRKVAQLLEGLGYICHGRATSGIIQEEMTRPTLWYLPGTTQSYAVAQLYEKE